MQPSLGVGPTGSAVDPGRPVSPTVKINRLAAAGVALAGAGVIAANPVVPVAPNSQQRDVQLTSTWDTASDNIDVLVDAISQPDPLSTTTGDVLQSELQTITNALQESFDGIEGIWSGEGSAEGLENILPQVSELLQDGNVTDAFTLVNTDFLFDLLNVFQPFFAHETSHGSGVMEDGVFSVFGNLTHDWGDFLDGMADFDLWKHSAKAVMGPFISLMFSISDHLTQPEGVEPQDPMDAFLNGYVPWDAPADADEGEDPHDPLTGLLTDDGPINYFLVDVPQQLADAMTEGTTVDANEIESALDGSDGIDFDDDAAIDEGEFVNALADHLDFSDGELSGDNIIDAIVAGGYYDDIDVDGGDDAFDPAGLDFSPEEVAEVLNSGIEGFDPSDSADPAADATADIFGDLASNLF